MTGTPFKPGNNAGKAGQFQPGQSGNPKGLSKGLREVAAAARVYTQEMLEILVKIARDTKASPAARAAACQYVIDRGHGKAPQYIELKRTTEMEQMTDDELHAIIAAGEVGETNGSGAAPETPSGESKPN